MIKLTSSQRKLLFSGAWDAHCEDGDSLSLSMHGFARITDQRPDGGASWATTYDGQQQLYKEMRFDLAAYHGAGFYMTRSEALSIADKTYITGLYPEQERERLVALEAYRLMTTPAMPEAEVMGMRGKASAILNQLIEQQETNNDE